MSISTLRRQVKNVAYNFSDAQVKVREATSNDPWGPSTALMSEIADLTNNPLAFAEIMSIIWKRLNDHGKNWRHVYKSLVLLDFLIKCGSEKVVTQCRENIYSIETLRDFQHVEENRDQGMNVREKAKQMVAFLADDERLQNERTRFMLTRNRLKQNIGTGGSGSRYHRSSEGAGSSTEYDAMRPGNATEEEMQMQIALALSREESEREAEMRKGDDVRLQMAIEESKRDAERWAATHNGQVSSSNLSQSALDDLLSLGVGTLDTGSSSSAPFNDPWATPTQNTDPWGMPARPQAGPSSSGAVFAATPPAQNDPWAPAVSSPTVASVTPLTTAPANVDPFSAWEQSGNNDALAPTAASAVPAQGQQRPNVKTPENFLGENSSLVNLDNLLGTSSSGPSSANPFLGSSSSQPSVNPFTANQRKSPTLNEMRAQMAGGVPPPVPQMGMRSALPPPIAPQQMNNPFAQY